MIMTSIAELNVASSGLGTATPGYKLFHSDLPLRSPSETETQNQNQSQRQRQRIPEDYHRFFLDPASLPSPKIVGVLACQRDPYLRKLRTKVSAVRTVEDDENSSSNSKAKANGNGKQKVNGNGNGKGKGGATAKEESKNGKNGGTKVVNGSTSVPNLTKDIWEIEFTDTVLFPEGGGQPNDTGLIHFQLITDASRPPLKVTNVFRRGLTAVHVVEVAQDEQRGKQQPVEEGEEVELEVDWERRVDHMTLHTAQHLLSALCDTQLNLPTLSWFLPPFPSLEPCYVELPRSVTQEEAKMIEDLANGLVTMGWGAKEEKEDVRVWIESKLQKFGSGSGCGSADTSGLQTPIEVKKAGEQEKQGLGLEQGLEKVRISGRAIEKVSVSEITAIDGSNSRLGLDSEKEDKEWGDRESRGLPKDYAGGIIRTAVISGIDRSLCCGTHHPSLARVGLLHVVPPSLGTTSNKPTRLYMLAGPRAIKHLLAASNDLSSSASHLGCSRFEVAPKIDQREQQRLVASKQASSLRNELGRLIGQSIAWQESESESGELGNTKKALISRNDEATHDFEFMGIINTAAMASLIESTTTDQDVNPAGKGRDPPPYLLVITSSLPSKTSSTAAAASPSPGSNDSLSTLVQITSFPHQLAKDVGDKLKNILDTLEGGEKGRVKGGGARGRWMGKVGGKWGKKEALALANCF